jgi:hypothetical protein
MIDGDGKAIAVLTILPVHLVALQQYCELIETDGTHPHLSLLWEVIPITMLDKGRHLACGGICLAAHLTTEVVFWILETILRVHGVADQWITLLTDENFAFIAAVASLRRIANFPEDFHHRMCAMHEKETRLRLSGYLFHRDTIAEREESTGAEARSPRGRPA